MLPGSFGVVEHGERDRSEIGQTYYAFWASLLPESNRQTGFSLRSPTRRPYVEYCCVGFCFRYRLAYATPNALVEFALVRSDGEQIYHSLVRRRKQINEAFGGSLLWLPEAHSSEHLWPYHTIACPSLRELDRESWSAVQSQMIDAMVRLERAVAPSSNAGSKRIESLCGDHLLGLACISL